MATAAWQVDQPCHEWPGVWSQADGKERERYSHTDKISVLTTICAIPELEQFVWRDHRQPVPSVTDRILWERERER